MTRPPHATPSRTLLETALPVAQLSRVVAADRRSRDPVYLAHRWFARRPPALLRGILLAASLPAQTTESQFWEEFSTGDNNIMQGLTVYDPFHGGGTTLIEAGRLGAHVAGRDVDPIATRLVRHQLQRMDLTEFDKMCRKLRADLSAQVGHLYPAPTPDTPLHYFSVARVNCPACKANGHLYRNLIIARGVKRNGSVARAPQLVVFCPTCINPKSVPLDSTVFRCCEEVHVIARGTWTGTRYTCPTCAEKHTHADLETGRAPRDLVGVEVTSETESRTIRAASHSERGIEEAARSYVEQHEDRLLLPAGSVEPDPRDSRPASFGLANFRDMFTSRQLAVFGTAFAWTDSQDATLPVRDALRLGISNALASNNRMCGYATDYGRLSALFSVRGYSIPALAVELNALHAKAGRGTIARTLNRVRSSMNTTVRRNIWNSRKGFTETVTHEHRFDPNATITAGSALDASLSDLGRPQADLVITDPPYFDFIPYDRLSAFYRAWTIDAAVVGKPLLPSRQNPTQSFGVGLGLALGRSAALLAPTGLLAFTYHSMDPEAWTAVGIALDEAKVLVTGLWPVLADPHMGHHGTAGACQFDIVVVARPLSQAQPSDPPFGVDGGALWLQNMALTLDEPDRVCALLAYQVCTVRWGTVVSADSSPETYAVNVADHEVYR